MTRLLKRTPLSGVYRKPGVSLTNVAGWEVPGHFGDPDRERQALESACVLVDWSHAGKIQLRGRDAAREAAKIVGGDGTPRVLEARAGGGCVLLRLAEDEVLMLCEPGQEEHVLSGLDGTRIAIVNESGGYGALLLAGPRRGEVMERSCALDLRPDVVGERRVFQTGVHFVPCTIYCAPGAYLLVQRRDFTQSLYESLLDVGRGIGLVQAGTGCVPTVFGREVRM